MGTREKEARVLSATPFPLNPTPLPPLLTTPILFLPSSSTHVLILLIDTWLHNVFTLRCLEFLVEKGKL